MKNSLLLSLLLFSIPVFGLPGSIRKKDGSPLKSEDVRNLNSMTLALPSEVLITRNIDTQISVLHDKKGFLIADNKTITRVKMSDVTPQLRNMDVEKAIKVLTETQLQVKKLKSGDYAIDKVDVGIGIQALSKLATVITYTECMTANGFGGAMIGFWVGKCSVYLAGHGAILGAAISSGWGFPLTLVSLEIQWGAQIEVTSNVVGHNAAVFALFATGPV